MVEFGPIEELMAAFSGFLFGALLVSIVMGYVAGSLLSPCMSYCYVSPECIRNTWAIVIGSTIVIFMFLNTVYDIWGRANEAKKPENTTIKKQSEAFK